VALLGLLTGTVSSSRRRRFLPFPSRSDSHGDGSLHLWKQPFADLLIFFPRFFAPTQRLSSPSEMTKEMKPFFFFFFFFPSLFCRKNGTSPSWSGEREIDPGPSCPFSPFEHAGSFRSSALSLHRQPPYQPRGFVVIFDTFRSTSFFLPMTCPPPRSAHGPRRLCERAN